MDGCSSSSSSRIQCTCRCSLQQQHMHSDALLSTRADSHSATVVDGAEDAAALQDADGRSGPTRRSVVNSNTTAVVLPPGSSRASRSLPPHSSRRLPGALSVLLVLPLYTLCSLPALHSPPASIAPRGASICRAARGFDRRAPLLRRLCLIMRSQSLVTASLRGPSSMASLWLTARRSILLPSDPSALRRRRAPALPPRRALFTSGRPLLAALNGFGGGGGGVGAPPSSRPWVDPSAVPVGEALAKYTLDLTQLAKDGKLDPVIGREEEMRRTIEVLSRRTKNNPVLLGEPGVGSSHIPHCAHSTAAASSDGRAADADAALSCALLCSAVLRGCALQEDRHRGGPRTAHR